MYNYVKVSKPWGIIGFTRKSSDVSILGNPLHGITINMLLASLALNLCNVTHLSLLD